MKSYLSPLYVIEQTEGVTPSLQDFNLSKQRKKLLTLLDLKEYPELVINKITYNKHELLKLIEELEDEGLREFHFKIFENKALLKFLEQGETDLLAIHNDYSILKEDRTFLNFISPYFSNVYNRLLIKGVENKDYYLLKALKQIKPLVSDQYESHCYESVYMQLKKKYNELSIILQFNTKTEQVYLFTKFVREEDFDYLQFLPAYLSKTKIEYGVLVINTLHRLKNEYHIDISFANQLINKIKHSLGIGENREFIKSLCHDGSWLDEEIIIEEENEIEEVVNENEKISHDSYEEHLDEETKKVLKEINRQEQQSSDNAFVIRIILGLVVLTVFFIFNIIPNQRKATNDRGTYLVKPTTVPSYNFQSVFESIEENGKSVSINKKPSFSNHMKTGMKVYTSLFSPSNESTNLSGFSASFINNSAKSMVGFIYQDGSEDWSQAVYVKPHENYTIFNLPHGDYQSCIYLGKYWSDTLIVFNDYLIRNNNNIHRKVLLKGGFVRVANDSSSFTELLGLSKLNKFSVKYSDSRLINNRISFEVNDATEERLTIVR